MLLLIVGQLKYPEVLVHLFLQWLPEVLMIKIKVITDHMGIWWWRQMKEKNKLEMILSIGTSGYLSCPTISNNILVWGFLLIVRILEREVRTIFLCPRVTWPNDPGPGLSQTMEQWTGTSAVTWDCWYIWWIDHVPGLFRGVWGLYNMSQGCFSGHFFPCGWPQWSDIKAFWPCLKALLLVAVKLE